MIREAFYAMMIVGLLMNYAAPQIAAAWFFEFQSRLFNMQMEAME
jgi:hypothetical protein